MTTTNRTTRDGLMTRQEALRVVGELSPSDLLGFDGFRLLEGDRIQPDSAFCFDMEELLTLEADTKLVASARSDREGRLLLARRIIEEAPEDLWFELVVR